MSCIARYSTTLFSREVHILGYDCSADWVFYALLAFTIALKIYQNKIWAEMGQAQRLALQYDEKVRGPYVWALVRKEAVSTTLGLVSIVLVLGTNVWVMAAIVLGNLWGVHRTYSRMTKDSHSTAHDILEMLHQHEIKPTNQSRRLIIKLQDILKKPTKLIEEYTDVPIQPNQWSF